MAVTGTFVINCRTNSEGYVAGGVTLTVDNGEIISDIIVANATANDVAIAPFEFAKLKGIYLLADGDVELTFVDGASNVVVNLVADEPQSWHYGDMTANPFTANVTGVIATESNGEDVLLTGRLYKDA